MLPPPMYVLVDWPEPVIRSVGVPLLVRPFFARRAAIAASVTASPVMSTRLHWLCGMPASDSASDERVFMMRVSPPTLIV